MPKDETPGIMERALELARSGKARSIEEVRFILRREHYEAVDGHISGAATIERIKGLIADATKQRFG